MLPKAAFSKLTILVYGPPIYISKRLPDDPDVFACTVS